MLECLGELDEVDWFKSRAPIIFIGDSKVNESGGLLEVRAKFIKVFDGDVMEVGT